MAILSQKKMLQELEWREKKALKKYMDWLRHVVELPSGVFSYQQVPNIQLKSRGVLSKIMREHILDAFSLGQAHGDLLCQVLHKKYNKRKLSSWIPSIFKTFKLADDESNSSLNDFNTLEAIESLATREIVLCDDVESNILSKIKQLVIEKINGASRKDIEESIASLLQSSINRAQLILTTETTYAYNKGRLSSFQSNQVDYVRFSAVMDGRTSQQCRSRHGLIMALDDPRLPANTPPLHGRCRSILLPIYSEYEPDAITKEALDWSKAKPLPKGWRTG